MTALPDPNLPIEHLTGSEALPRIAEALVTHEPAVLVSTDGRGAIYAPDGDHGPAGDHVWLLVDAAGAADWSDARRPITLSFCSRDQRVFATVAGVAQPMTYDGIARSVWRESFGPWFSSAEDARLLVVRVIVSSAEYRRAPHGRVTSGLPS